MGEKGKTRAQIQALVEITDKVALWQEAYQSITEIGDLDATQILDLIGFRDRPDVISCLEAIIAQPNRIPGTKYIEVSATPFDGMFPPRRKPL